MRKKIGRKINLRPRLVTVITASFMIITTTVSSLSIVVSSRTVRELGDANIENIKAQAIKKNMEIRRG